MQSSSHRREGDLFAGKSPIHNAHIPPARSSPTNPSSIPHFDPLTSPTCHSWQARKAGHKKKQNVATGTKCGVLGMHRRPIQCTQHQGAGAENRWLIADCLLVLALWVYQNFKKAFTPPTSSIPLWDSQRSGFGSNAVAQSSPLPWLLELKFD